MSHTVGNMKTQATQSSSESEFSADEGDQNTNTEPVCVVCLTQRNNTWVFIPCRHASGLQREDCDFKTELSAMP